MERENGKRSVEGGCFEGKGYAVDRSVL